MEVADFAGKMLAFQKAIDNIIERKNLRKTDIEDYARAKLEMLEASSKTADALINNELESPESSFLLENPALRTLIDPMNFYYQTVKNKWEEFRQMDPSITETEFLCADLLSGSLNVVLLETKEIEEKLRRLPQSPAAKELLEIEAPETWAALVERYGPEQKPVIQNTPPDLSGGPG
jgi:hypothetical protein